MYKKRIGKNSSKEWKLINIALWGYSTVMLLFLTFFTLIPTGGDSAQVSDPIAGIFSLAPIVIFLILVLIEHKRYKWNIWKVILCVYSWLLIGFFIVGVLLIILVTSHMGVSQSSSSSFLGVLYLPVLAFFVIMGYEKFT